MTPDDTLPPLPPGVELTRPFATPPDAWHHCVLTLRRLYAASLALQASVPDPVKQDLLRVLSWREAALGEEESDRQWRALLALHGPQA